MRHILLTNDFPPKVGGIQSYLWELWRRLPPDDVTVLTASRDESDWWDAQQKFRVIRSREPVLLPNPHLARKVRRLAGTFGAEAVVIDPALPLGLLGPHLGLPYALVLHGAEVTVPGRLPVSRQLLVRALSSASLWIAAGGYPEAEARRAIRGGGKAARSGEVPKEVPKGEVPKGDVPSGEVRGGGPVGEGPVGGGPVGEGPVGEGPVGEGIDASGSAGPPSVRIPPGVDTERFHPLARIDRLAARARFGLAARGPLVVSVSRLVPRKGMDTLIEAAGRASSRIPGLSVAIAGDGRDRGRLERLAAASTVPVKLLGELTDAELPEFYASSDCFALCSRSRWGGLEQEGFGAVLVEAASSGVPCITIEGGGVSEAVVDGETGFVVRPAVKAKTGRFALSHGRAAEADGVAEALVQVLTKPALARRMGEAGRRRAERELSYDVLALRLAEALSELAAPPGQAPRPLGHRSPDAGA